MLKILLLFMSLSAGVNAQLPREHEHYAIVNLVVQKRDAKNIFIFVTNDILLSFTDTLERFYGINFDSIIPIDKVQQQDFVDQLKNSTIKIWDQKKLLVNLEKTDAWEARSAALANHMILPRKYKSSFNRKSEVLKISLPVMTIDRKTAYVAVREEHVEFNNDRLEGWCSRGGVYILDKSSDRWKIKDFIASLECQK